MEFRRVLFRSKFLAKIASDWNKPDGGFVVRPSQVEAFLTPLPVAKIPGVGKVMEKKLADLGIATVGELRGFAAEELQLRFGSFGRRLHLRAQGIAARPVHQDKPVQTDTAEDTFKRDLTLNECEADHTP